MSETSVPLVLDTDGYRVGRFELSLKQLEILILVILAVVILALVFNIRFTWGRDDQAFLDFTNPEGRFGGSVVEFVRFRWQTWTSRWLIEGTLFLLTRSVFLWRIGTALAAWLCIVIPPWLITSDRRSRIPLLIGSALLFASIPALTLFDAGLLATSVNYLWALAGALLAALPALFLLRGQRVSMPLVIGAALCGLFAGSMEIVAVFLLVLYGVVAGRWFWMRRQENLTWRAESLDNPMERLENRTGEIVMLLAFATGFTAMVLLHLTNPGNAARGTTNWLSPTFPVIFERAYSTTLRTIFLSGYVIPLAYFSALIWRIIRRGLGLVAIGAAIVPLAGSLILSDQYFEGTLGVMISNTFAERSLLWLQEGPHLVPALAPANLMSFLILTVLFTCAIWATVLAFRGSPRLWAVLLILGLGFASKFIVVNSIDVTTAIGIKFHRTDLFLLYAFSLATLLAVAPSGYRPVLKG
ncbi:MAG: hypothetical protein FWG25_08605 [Promicromonosporaceae bacterium]|nr:hypothetical protein [Promicromonosporaceae bacterium]